MSAKTTYECDLCKREIVLHPPGMSNHGYALRWEGNDTLRIAHGTESAPFHVCAKCMAAVADIHERIQGKR